MLCPGWVRTQIFDSRRNLPQRFAAALGPPPTLSGPMATAMKMGRERLEAGIDPGYVGELVREGVENNWPYNFTDTEFEPLIEARFEAIKQGFDRIRGRKPKR